MYCTYARIHPAGFCPIIIIADKEDRFIQKIIFQSDFNAEPQETPLLKEALAQLHAYFAGALREFDLPLQLQGTPFQMSVWNALREIPYGEVRSYKDIAGRIGNPGAGRAVGMANHRNPISIVVPCHRVINHNGELGGYAPGVKYKKILLNLEKVNF